MMSVSDDRRRLRFLVVLSGVLAALFLGLLLALGQRDAGACPWPEWHPNFGIPCDTTTTSTTVRETTTTSTPPFTPEVSTTVPDDPTTTTTEPRQELPATGSSNGVLVALAVVLVNAGAASLVLARRRGAG